jgi:YHYH protein
MCDSPNHSHAKPGIGRHGEHHHEHGALMVPSMLVSRRAVFRLGGVGLGAALLGACTKSAGNSPGSSSVDSNPPATATTSSAAPATSTAPLLEGFDMFADTVGISNDGTWWLVESNGMPSHNMMVGITSWQQQVPTPQMYTGDNSWRIPMNPVIADVPVSAKTQLYRGAIALAANGVPIFNALNNRGDDAYLYGELDQWGGHAGRADDYHYHIAPLHLQDTVGANRPIAYALDGYPIYGETEPDGSAVGALDEFNGHTMPDGAYHYHGTRTYPYINGGLRGVVNVVGDQIDPQPVTKPFRDALQPLAGATIVSFDSPASGSYRLGYSIKGSTGEVAYVVSDNQVTFTFTDVTGSVTTETYARRP